MNSSMASFLGFSLLAFIPIIGWLIFFRKQLPHNIKYLVLTFIAGMISVLPIKLYQAYWDIALWKIEHWNLFNYLADVSRFQSLPSLLAYVVMTVLVLWGLFLFVAVLMFLLEVLSGDNTVKVFKQKFFKILEAPFFFVGVGVICGFMAYFFSLSLHEKIWFFLMVGILEEFVKHLVLRFADEYKIHSVREALQFSIVVALGFGFVENILYFTKISESMLLSGQAFLIMMLLRSIISVGAHVCFSGILGYYYGVAKFATEIYQEESLQKRHRVIEGLHKILHLKKSVLFHDQKMMEGVLLAMGLHAVFNSLLEFGLVTLVFPFVVGMLLNLLYLWHKQNHHECRGEVYCDC